MKKVFWMVTLVALLVLAGCGAKTEEAPAAANEPATSAGEIIVSDEGLGNKNVMLLGLYNLDKVGEPLTTEQAAELVTLWQAYKAVTTSGTSATEETEALINQMQGLLTGEQIAAINAMALDGDDLLAFYSEVGIEIPTPAPGETPVVRGSGAGQNLTEEEKAARREASGEEGGGGSSRATIVIDKVIEYLQAAS